MRSRRPFDAAMLAAAPAMVVTAFVNWDMLVVALCTLGLYAWARRNPAWAGVLLGLAAAAKFYPLFILGPLFLLCLRHRKIRPFLTTAGCAVLAWLAVNLPVIFAAGVPAWSQFYRFSEQRAVDWGTFWYVGANLTGDNTGPLAGIANNVGTLNTISGLVFVLWCGGHPSRC
ncbi:glycosyltransferase 87 family protein [Fodinicola feengrottensis]|uniref:glycosyltransferase 87 family protein n=1 Tax=Fodinicola feengrottensis TaxID=435914 RepID=UPI002442F0F1|nr:glycosyltransferase 87 family protein [Fodinicola feengrottensis]